LQHGSKDEIDQAVATVLTSTLPILMVLSMYFETNLRNNI
jgi:hypothetical protein